MKTILAALAALTALSAAPAFAAPGDYDRGAPTYRQNDDRVLGGQYGDRNDGRYAGGYEGGYQGGYQGNQNVDSRDLSRLDMMIDRGMRDGSINMREARMLKSDLRDIRTMQARFWRTGGLDYRERAILDRRVDNLRAAIFRESNDRGGRYPGGWR